MEPKESLWRRLQRLKGLKAAAGANEAAIEALSASNINIKGKKEALAESKKFDELSDRISPPIPGIDKVGQPLS